MKPQTIVMFLFIVFIIVWLATMYFNSDEYNLKCVIASKDGNRYCIRDRKHLQPAANLLSSVTANCTKMVVYMKKTHPDDPRVKRLVEGFNPKAISETLPTSELTAYSENKGAKIAFCLSKSKNGSKLIDLNTLTFVALHELSHIMTSSIGHKQDFWENFKFLLENAKQAGIYNPEDYKKNPQDYCGEKIDDNPYFDLI
jgi:hypothetical protein